MPKGVSKGKDRKNKGGQAKKDITLKEEGQEYGLVKAKLGNNRLSITMVDGKTRIGVIRGAIRNKMWISVGDIVLVSIRDYEGENGHVDVLLKYSPDEAKTLIKTKEVPAQLMSASDQSESRKDRVVDYVIEDDDDELGEGEDKPVMGNQPAPNWEDSDDDEDVDIDDI